MGSRCGFSDFRFCLIPLLALALALAHTNFPQFMPCELQPSGVVDCDRRSLGFVPSFSGATPTALANVTSLLLRHNHIKHLQPDHFTHLPNLRQILLRWNCAPTNLTALRLPCQMVIEPGTFLGLHKLELLDLSGNSITSIPDLPPSLTSLVISYTMILALESASFSGLPRLRSLYMDGNCYYKNPCEQEVTVSQGALANLRHLTNLSLKYDSLTSVPKGLPASLQMLLISSNHIVSLSPQDFAGLPALRVLDVSRNCRRCDHAYNPCKECPKGYPKVDPDTFSHLGALEGLVLRDNSLCQLDPRWFQNLGNLTVLDLGENFLSEDITTTTAFQNLTKLKKLNLSFNYHKKVSYAQLHLSLSFKYLISLEVLDMTGIFFRSLSWATIEPLLDLPSFQKLLLPMNFIHKADLSVFGHFRSLKYVDLSGNKVTGFSNVMSVNAEPAPSTELLPRLKRTSQDHPHVSEDFMPHCGSTNFILDLSQNNLVTIHPEMFNQLSTVECLRLSRNSIDQAVNGSQFNLLTNLWLLDLSHNKLDLYYSEAFTELPNLKALDLSFNSQSFRAQGIGHNLSFITNLPNLRYLSLAHNQIYTRVSRRLNSSSLEALDFSGNLLSRMWAEGDLYKYFFYGLSRLDRLDLSRNKLHTLPDQALAHLPKSLRVLWAKDNHITFFNWSCLHLLPSLEELDLSGNLLGRLSTGYIPGDTQLRRLDLSRNGIDSISQGFFIPASRLQVLNLSGNALKTLDRGWFGGVALSLRELDVRANPLHCECDTAFLEFLLEIQATVPGLTSQVVCGSPFLLKGKSVFTHDLRLCLDVRLACSCFAFSLLGTLLTLGIPTLQRLFGWDLWYSFHLGLAWLPWRVWQKQKASAYDYDAFVVFDKAQDAVADWVYNELRVHMEEGQGRGKGRFRFRLCLEDRDWLPGKSLIENLWDSVYSSRKTVFVLSSRGPLASQPVSGLLRATFYLTQQRLLDDKQDVVVLVILNRAVRKSRYVRLRQRLCRQTVLFWPHQPSGQGSFWAQLCTALATNNRSFYNQNFCRGP